MDKNILKCPNCGSNSFKDIGDSYQCAFCQTVVPKKTEESRSSSNAPQTVVHVHNSSENSFSSNVAAGVGAAGAGVAGAGAGCLTATAMAIIIPILGVIGVIVFCLLFIGACAQACSTAQY